jgi:hypothetical protein
MWLTDNQGFEHILGGVACIGLGNLVSSHVFSYSFAGLSQSTKRNMYHYSCGLVATDKAEVPSSLSFARVGSYSMTSYSMAGSDSMASHNMR